ncbi:EamA family transporter [Streptomyces sp. NPDC093064]|uniref:EamA family transporter n=1 Tax=Streptomyces sp. NPDC093064 TaxID=3366020 RepID=UPI0037F911DF
MPGIVLRTPQALSPAVGLATGAPLLSSWSDTAVGAYMALVPMFIGYVLFGWGLAHVPASTATTLSLLEPAVAAVLAVLVVGERLPLLGWHRLGRRLPHRAHDTDPDGSPTSSGHHRAQHQRRGTLRV